MTADHHDDPLDHRIRAIAALGQDVAMPSRITPDMPPRVAAVQRVMTGAARLIVLRQLMKAGDSPSTRADVASRAGLNDRSAWVAIQELEELGYVTAVTAPKGDKPGRRAQHYQADRARLEADLDAFTAWMLGR